MKRVVFTVACLAIAGTPVRGQVKNTQEGEAILGVIGQNDTKTVTGVRIYPVGLNIGFIVQPLFNNRRFAIVEQLSYFPVSGYERKLDPLGQPYPGNSKPLVVNTIWGRLSTDEPEASGQNVLFAGGGFNLAISTPRTGTKTTGMLAVGARRWFARQVGVEVSLQCSVPRLGRTQCTMPFTTVWPFG